MRFFTVAALFATVLQQAPPLTTKRRVPNRRGESPGEAQDGVGEGTRKPVFEVPGADSEPMAQRPLGIYVASNNRYNDKHNLA